MARLASAIAVAGILSADANVMAKTEVDQVWRCSKIEIARTFSVWAEDPPEPAGIRDHEAVEAMVARVVQAWGRVDVLVANAGGGRGRPMDTKASTLDPVLLQLVTAMNLFCSGPSIRATRSPRC